MARLPAGGSSSRIAAGVAASAAMVAGGAGIWSQLDDGRSAGRDTTLIAADGMSASQVRARVHVRDGDARRRGGSQGSHAGGGGPAGNVPSRGAAPAQPGEPAVTSPPAPTGNRPSARPPTRSQHHNPGTYVAVGDEQVVVENNNAPGAGVTVDPENGSVTVEAGGCVNVPPVFGGCP